MVSRVLSTIYSLAQRLRILCAFAPLRANIISRKDAKTQRLAPLRENIISRKDAKTQRLAHFRLCVKTYIILLLFFCVNTMFGQGLKFGIHFDPIITWLQSEDDVETMGTRLGFNFGMSADYYFAQNYAFATGISLFNTGGTVRYADDIKLQGKTIRRKEDVIYKIQYVNIPVGLKFKTHRIGRMIYSANLGFNPMIRVTGHADIPDEKNMNVNSDIKFINLGWHFGGGVAYSLGGEAAVFGGLAFMKTFTDMTKSYDRITSANLVLRVGVMF